MEEQRVAMEAAEAAEETGVEAPDAGEEEFEALIRGRCKEQFDARVQKILDGRLRGLRRENQRLREAQERDRSSARAALEQLEGCAEAVKAVYPDFDWKKELADPRFGRMILAGVDARAAYEVVHREEVLRRAMAYSADRAARQAAQTVASGVRRVGENGRGGSVVTRVDPGKLNRQELADIRQRVMDGEKIRF